MASLRTQEVIGCGERKIWLDPNEIDSANRPRRSRGYANYRGDTTARRQQVSSFFRKNINSILTKGRPIGRLRGLWLRASHGRQGMGAQTLP